MCLKMENIKFKILKNQIMRQNNQDKYTHYSTNNSTRSMNMISQHFVFPNNPNASQPNQLKTETNFFLELLRTTKMNITFTRINGKNTIIIQPIQNIMSYATKEFTLKIQIISFSSFSHLTQHKNESIFKILHQAKLSFVSTQLFKRLHEKR